MKKTKTRSNSARILPSIAALFLVAAAIRMTVGLNAALASSNDTAQTAHPDQDSVQTAIAIVPQTAAQDQAMQLLNLRERELALNEQEASLSTREHELEQARHAMRSQIEALQAAEAALSATMALADSASENDITRLVSIFEAMEPEQAAAVFTEMDTEFAAGFIGRLAPATAAEILAGLDPRHAYGLSAILAGRNASVPTH